MDILQQNYDLQLLSGTDARWFKRFCSIEANFDLFCSRFDILMISFFLTIQMCKWVNGQIRKWANMSIRRKLVSNC
jgi:hypothetical protein